MAPRAYWKGYLRLSLLSCPIQLFPATSEREKNTGDEVEEANIIKGYELEKGRYIQLTSDEMDAAAIESARVIDIEQFVPGKEIDELYVADPYYIVPDGEVGAQPFAVIRDAIKQEGMVALGRVVFTSREHVIALKPRGKGLMGVTLRYPYEVRNEKEYFDQIPDEKVTKDMLDLARHIVETKSGHFQPSKFEDHYEEALKESLNEKQHGQEIVATKEKEPSKVINLLMDALRRSAKADTSAPRRGRKRVAGQTEMLFPIQGNKIAQADKKPARSNVRKRKTS
jgi:DNA end-binding protein Ku